MRSLIDFYRLDDLMAQRRENIPLKDGHQIDLHAPVKPTRETLIKWHKGDLEDFSRPMDAKIYAIKELARYGEVDYLRDFQTRAVRLVERLKQEIERMEANRFQNRMIVERPVLEAARKTPDWEKLSEKEQTGILIDIAVNSGSADRIKKYDEKLDAMKRNKEIAEKLIAEIEKVLPPPTKDSLF